jgi:hypothetical protein
MAIVWGKAGLLVGEVLSWAVKFFIDAQLMEHLISEHRPPAEVRAVW